MSPLARLATNWRSRYAVARREVMEPRGRRIMCWHMTRRTACRCAALSGGAYILTHRQIDQGA